MVKVGNSSPAPGEADLLASDNQTKSDDQTADAVRPVKKKRNLPGMPDPDAEVIALSPKTLLATNRFVCEICNKGFQRDQNLQLHRRGHNLPWKLRQRTGKEVRKRVYVCPEPSCVHHDPSRALGDLTGIKKHFSRKHGEKKYKCERCSKKYAVPSDWKAHMKTCGTREYRCDCGTLFSRRDSFITHRAFCDALAEESARSQPAATSTETAAAAAAATPPLTPSTGVLSPVISIQSCELPENQNCSLQPPSLVNSGGGVSTLTATSSTGRALPNIFNPPSAASEVPLQSSPPPSSFSGLLCATAPPVDHMALSLSSSLYSATSSLFPVATSPPAFLQSPPSAALSATALLQKAAQMGATSSNSSFLRGLGLAAPSSHQFDQHRIASTTAAAASTSGSSHGMKLESSFGIGLGQPSAAAAAAAGVSVLNGVMMTKSTLLGGTPATVDFLGLGMGDHGEVAGAGGFSAFLNSIGGGLNIPTTTTATMTSFPGGETTWDESSDRKPPPSSML
ncbi:zinc finger protein GAI-ASSOCIATED FACTOR 1-like [Andrographis paniculata]|uniref:zinc finger protein GAI-ASSOCIATED FACTOR 1-like n=1 Tax=Andrographis paniculata TaxID=175694 RepID=UPI0021E8B2A2|nr:zinc finger protein GAI-ASSOCIATED FACTOR 1-like [Andrographis paniculata]